MKANALNQVTFKITLSGSIFITQRALLPPPPLPLLAKGRRGSCPSSPPPSSGVPGAETFKFQQYVISIILGFFWDALYNSVLTTYLPFFDFEPFFLSERYECV
jgi:hypothetical protein